MSTFSKLKRAFGFGPNEDDEIIADDPEINVSSHEASPGGETNMSIMPDSVTDIDLMTSNIFEHVVIQFNSALPDFLKSSVDSERQKKYLYETLSADIKNHLSTIESNVMTRLEESWHSERNRLQADLKQLEQNAREIESKRADLKEKQLSADRQRRALSDRVRDLEKQIMSLEAEKEQYELETKSLVNKVKVAQVYEKDLEAMREQVAYLQSELNKRSQQVADTENPEISESAVSDEELKRLRDIENEYNILISTLGDLEKKMDEVQVETEAKNNEIKSLRDELASLKNQPSGPSDEVIQLTNRLTSVQAELEVALKAIEAAEHRAQKAEKALESAQKQSPQQVRQPKRQPVSLDDDIITDTDWTISTPVRKQRKNNNNKRDRNDEGELSLW